MEPACLLEKTISVPVIFILEAIFSNLSQLFHGGYGSLLVTHKDQIVELPPDSELLGWSSYCPNSMFLTGGRFLGIQPHPEFEVPSVRELILSRTLRIGEDKVNRAMETIDGPADSLIVARWILNFLGKE
jgi:hypothetical protein